MLTRGYGGIDENDDDDDDGYDEGENERRQCEAEWQMNTGTTYDRIKKRLNMDK